MERHPTRDRSAPAKDWGGASADTQALPLVAPCSAASCSMHSVSASGTPFLLSGLQSPVPSLCCGLQTVSHCTQERMQSSPCLSPSRGAQGPALPALRGPKAAVSQTWCGPPAVTTGERFLWQLILLKAKVNVLTYFKATFCLYSSGRLVASFLFLPCLCNGSVSGSGCFNEMS